MNDEAKSVVADLQLLARFGVRGSRGWARSIAHPWAPISSRLAHMVYLLPFLGETRLRFALFR